MARLPCGFDTVHAEWDELLLEGLHVLKNNRSMFRPDRLLVRTYSCTAVPVLVPAPVAG
eukprot:COSAG05_NODE_24662_length_235_cov_2.536765_1_plen_58_part_10